MKLEIAERTFPTPDSVTLRFAGKKTLENYKPGQYGIFTFHVDGDKFTRTYSFHPVSDIDSDPAITIRRVGNGKVSTFVHSNTVPQVKLEEITGAFYVEPSQETKHHLVMFAGGSGITPIMAMIRAILEREHQSSISLVYSNRNHESIIFQGELGRLENKFPQRLKILHVLTQQDLSVFQFLFCQNMVFAQLYFTAEQHCPAYSALSFSA